MAVLARLWLRAAAALFLPAAYDATAGFGKPAMGFNNCNVQIALGLSNWTCCSGNQRLFEATAGALKATGLQQLGYVYVNTDDGWMDVDRSLGGRDGAQVVQNQSWRFPDWQGMIDRLHDAGFKFGLYTAMGTRSCCGRATSCHRETVDAEQYNIWGVDYVKDDSCSSCPGAPRHGAVLAALNKMQGALDATGRSILFSGEGGPDPAICSATGQCGNLRRIGHDITPYWSSITSMIDLSYGLAQFAHNDSAPHSFGFFNDMDVLEVGNGEFDCATAESVERAKAHFGMWSLMKSSLLLGTDLTFTANPALKHSILSIVGSHRVIGINQVGACLPIGPPHALRCLPLAQGSPSVVYSACPHSFATPAMRSPGCVGRASEQGGKRPRTTCGWRQGGQRGRYAGDRGV